MQAVQEAAAITQATTHAQWQLMTEAPFGNSHPVEGETDNAGPRETETAISPPSDADFAAFISRLKAVTNNKLKVGY